jgi:methyl-galactoside transport system ATP-binding protein
MEQEILMQDSEFILEMNHISKSFPGVKALDDVTFKVRRGVVHALMGENGAGKSTLMKCAFGLYHPNEGEIRFDGQPIRLVDTRDALNYGIAMIHQELQPIRTRSTMENVWVGRIPYRKMMGIHWVDDQKLYSDTKKLLDELEININPRTKAGSLSASHCQLLEIARAVSYDAKVIIMDEPTSSLTEVEAELLFKIIKKLTDKGVAIIYISHKIDEILKIAQDVTIMRDGKIVGTWPAEELNTDVIVKRMVGREMSNRFPPKKHIPGEVCLEIKNFSSANEHSFQDVNLSLHKSEILGIGGLVGAQRTELVESFFGLRPIKSGKLILNGKETCIRKPKDAISNNIALVTEDRRLSGIISKFSVMENIILANQTANPKTYMKGLFLDDKKRKADAEKYVEALSIKTPSIRTLIQYLSGGNQQKTVISRWMLTDPEILILDEPTRGIDVGAKYEIYCLMEQMAMEGKAIIMISSEMPELLGMSDRIAVMCEGRLSGVLDSKTATDEKVMFLASSYEYAMEE